MQQHNRAWPQAFANAPPDLLHAGFGRIEHAKRPAEHRIAHIHNYRYEKWTPKSVRRPERPWSHPHHRLDRIVRFSELRSNLFGTGEVQLHVIISVITNRVPSTRHVPCGPRKPPHVIANHEERRGHAELRKGVENRRRGSLVRPVVERQVNPPIPGATLDRRPEDQIEPHHPVTRRYTASTRCATSGHAYRSATRRPSRAMVARRAVSRQAPSPGHCAARFSRAIRAAGRAVRTGQNRDPRPAGRTSYPRRWE